MTDATATRPYLDGPIGLDRTETLIAWARYLGRTFGTVGALTALRYYERLAWLTPAARRDVEHQLRGLPLDDLRGGADDPIPLPDGLDGLADTPFAPHARSLAYVAALAGDDLAGDVLRTTTARHDAGLDVDVDARRRSERA